MARTSTRTVERIEAVAELIIGGHGLTPELAPKNSLYASRVRFAATEGGFVAASVSEWNEVRIIHRTGVAKSRASSQAAMPAAVLFRVGSIRDFPRPNQPKPRRRDPVLSAVGPGGVLWGAAGVRVLIVLPPS
jgi:hypothetical protein